MKEASKRQQQLLSYILSYQEEYGISPTLKEIGEELSISPQAVHYALLSLKKKNLISFDSGKPRTLSLSSLRDERENIAVPYFETEPSVLDLQNGTELRTFVSLSLKGKDIFSFKVTSFSMIGEGIKPGDKAYLKRTDKAIEGDIVLALASGDTEKKMELRRLRRNRDFSELWPENDSMGIIRSKNIKVYGVLLEIRRSY